MRMENKLKNRSGFTLAETLLAVLILLLVSTIVATGVPVAQRAYEKVVVAANAQLLLSTTATALRDELGTAWDVSIIKKTIGSKQTDVVSYFSADTGALSELYTDSTGIMLKEYNVVDNLNQADAKVLDSRLLVTEEAADKKEGLVATYTGVGVSGDYIVFSGMSVKKGATVLASLKDPLKIKVLWAKG